MKSRKIIYITAISLILISLATIIYSTYAFFSAEDEVKNTFVMGNVEVDLDEPSWDDNKAKNYIPGKNFIKDPTLTGLKGDSYGRLILEFKDSDGNLIVDKDRIALIKQIIWFDVSYDEETGTSNLIENYAYSLKDLESMQNEAKIYNFYNMEQFTLDNSRSTLNHYVFEYSGVLKKGDKAILFSNIVIPLDFNNMDIELLGDFQLEIKAEAIQIKGFTNRADAFMELDR